MGCGIVKIKNKGEFTNSSHKDSEIIRRPKIYTVSDLRNVKLKGLYIVNEVGSSQEISLNFSKEFKRRPFYPNNKTDPNVLTTQSVDKERNLIPVE